MQVYHDQQNGNAPRQSARPFAFALVASETQECAEALLKAACKATAIAYPDVMGADRRLSLQKSVQSGCTDRSLALHNAIERVFRGASPTSPPQTQTLYGNRSPITHRKPPVVAGATAVTCWPHIQLIKLVYWISKGLPKGYVGDHRKHLAMLSRSRNSASFQLLARVLEFEYTRTDPERTKAFVEKLSKFFLTYLKKQYLSNPWNTFYITACGVSGATPNNNPLESFNHAVKSHLWPRMRASKDAVHNHCLPRFVKAMALDWTKPELPFSPIALDRTGTPMQYAEEVHNAAVLLQMTDQQDFKHIMEYTVTSANTVTLTIGTP